MSVQESEELDNFELEPLQENRTSRPVIETSRPDRTQFRRLDCCCSCKLCFRIFLVLFLIALWAVYNLRNPHIFVLTQNILSEIINTTINF